MIIFEKKKTELSEGISQETFEAAAEKDADYMHICGHDKSPPEPCRRVLIKK